MLMTPTRRVNIESSEKSSFEMKKLIKESCSLLLNIKQKHPEFSDKILIGGLLGCKGDAYSAENQMNENEAYQFHSNQTNIFKDTGVDYLMAGIMPKIHEIIGLARAMADTQIPYIISFMIRKDGRLIDGTPISEAIEIVDKSVAVKPFGYMTNCIHPNNLLEALAKPFNKTQIIKKRFYGIQANASALSPEELNNCGVLQQGDYNELVNGMEELHKKYGFQIFGGCCGTNDVFIDKLSKKLNSGNAIEI